jgi:hypothetical protein
MIYQIEAVYNGKAAIVQGGMRSKKLAEEIAASLTITVADRLPGCVFKVIER